MRFIVLVILMLSSLTQAKEWIAPFEKRVLTPVDVSRFPGVCAPISHSRINYREWDESDFFKKFVNDQIFQSAADAAKSVYLLPDLESKNSGQKWLEEFFLFARALPPAYEFYAYMSEPMAGMKYVILEPVVPDAPWILAIAGTQSVLDWIVDLDLGRAQMEKLALLMDLFTGCQYLDREGNPLASHRWIMTGHSLGGGLAQAVAYQIQEKRRAKALQPVDIDLVTFNAFGAQGLVEKFGAFDTDVLESLRVRNFFVRGDPVSRIGTHIGPTYELDMVQGARNASIFSPTELARRHSMELIEEIRGDDLFLSGFVTRAKAASPPAVPLVKGLHQVGAIARFVPVGIYDSRLDRIVNRLAEAAAAAANLDLAGAENQTVARYVQRLISSRIAQIRSPSNGLMAQVYIEKLEAAGRLLRQALQKH